MMVWDSFYLEKRDSCYLVNKSLLNLSTTTTTPTTTTADDDVTATTRTTRLQSTTSNNPLKVVTLVS